MSRRGFVFKHGSEMRKRRQKLLFYVHMSSVAHLGWTGLTAGLQRGPRAAQGRLLHDYRAAANPENPENRPLFQSSTV